MIAFKFFYQDELLKLAATIQDHERKRFEDTIANNSNYHHTLKNGRVIVKLYDGPDWARVEKLAEAARFKLSDVDLAS